MRNGPEELNSESLRHRTDTCGRSIRSCEEWHTDCTRLKARRFGGGDECRSRLLGVFVLAKLQSLKQLQQWHLHTTHVFNYTEQRDLNEDRHGGQRRTRTRARGGEANVRQVEVQAVRIIIATKAR